MVDKKFNGPGFEARVCLLLEGGPPSPHFGVFKRQGFAQRSQHLRLFLDAHEKGLALTQVLALVSTGRRGGIRTRDPLHPMQVRYQAALHAEGFNYTEVNGKFSASTAS